MKPRRVRRQSPLLPVLLIMIFLVVLVILFAWKPKEALNENINTSGVVNGETNANVSLTNKNTNTPMAPEVERMTYTDIEFGFMLEFPRTWKTDVSENGEGENRIVNYTFGTGETGVTLVVLPTSLEGVIRETLSVVSEKEVTINGLAAKKITARSTKDGSPLSLIFFTKGDTLFDLNGPADLVEDIGSTFQLRNNSSN